MKRSAMRSLNNQFPPAMDGLDDRSVAWLRRQGVPEIAIDLWPGPVGVAAIETHPLGLFDFAEHGRRAFIQPVLSGGEFTDTVDLIAWYPDNPGRWWTCCYSGVPLGVDQLDRAEIEGEPLLLQPTPLNWLCGGGNGVVVTDWAMSAPALRCVPTLITEEAEHGRYIQRRLRIISDCPEIRVLRNEAA